MKINQKEEQKITQKKEGMTKIYDANYRRRYACKENTIILCD
jgi:hypothetical protein